VSLPLAVSNIAWPAGALEEALDLLPGLGVSGVEIAPFNVFGRWNNIGDDARRLRGQVEARGLRIVALQGILFNAPEVHLFASAASREALRRHLDDVAALAGVLGAGACVLGAPRQRDPGGMAPAEAWAVARDFLRGAGPAFAAAGSALAFEPNARRYNCRFVTGTAEAAQLVAEVATPGIGLQIDTGTIFLEEENPVEALRAAAPVAVHAHLSEPDLRPVEGTGLNHEAVAAALHGSGYGGVLSIEMRAAPDWRAALRTAVELARRTYA
jgi:sugar phosphate isomerase/epimerase